MLEDMAQANLEKVHFGALAIEKSQSAEIKHFAQMRVGKHTTGLGESGHWPNPMVRTFRTTRP